MLDDPLTRPVRSRRLQPAYLWLLLLFVVIVGAGSFLYYLHVQRQARPNVPTYQPAQVGTGSGFRKTAYQAKKAEPPATNGVPHTAPTPVIASQPLPQPRLVQTPPVAPRPRQRRPQAQLVVLTSAAQPKPLLRSPLYTLPGWTYIPATVENVLISEVAGFFTVVTKRPMHDLTRQHTLIPHGQRIGGKAVSEYLLLGNERIPTVAVSMTVGEEDLELGKCVIMDESGTNGLTGLVDNHTWRIVWTSIFIEGLNAGQQVLQHELSNTDGDGDSVTISGVGQYSSNLARQRLGRSQDTRPTITVESGQGCQILCPHALKLPAF